MMKKTEAKEEHPYKPLADLARFMRENNIKRIKLDDFEFELSYTGDFYPAVTVCR